MNKLELKIEKFTPPGDKTSIELVGIYIDGNNLADYAYAYEKTKWPDDYRESYVGDLPDFFLKNMQSESGRDIAILISPWSLDVDDWPVKMNFDYKDGKVIWSGFYNARMNDPKIGGHFWDYSDFPTFTFDEEEYKQELAKISNFVTEKKTV